MKPFSHPNIHYVIIKYPFGRRFVVIKDKNVSEGERLYFVGFDDETHPIWSPNLLDARLSADSATVVDLAVLLQMGSWGKLNVMINQEEC